MKRKISNEIELIYSAKTGQGRVNYYDNNKEIIAFLDFVVEMNKIASAYHTFTSPTQQGKGLARQIVNVYFDFCQKQGYIIKATCSYVAQVISRSDFPYPKLVDTYDSSSEIIEKLKSISTPELIARYSKYFKTEAGAYAENDVFLGISVPKLRQIEKTEGPLTTTTLLELCRSPYHEARWIGFLGLRKRMEASKDIVQKRITHTIFDSVIKYCNNWDLVDNFGAKIQALYIQDFDYKRKIEVLESLSLQGTLWLERMSIVITLEFIKAGSYKEALHIVKYHLKHKHDLIHKAMGWVLREIGKYISKEVLCQFLEQYADKLPRTSLRYAIEHFSDEERRYYMRSTSRKTN